MESEEVYSKKNLQNIYVVWSANANVSSALQKQYLHSTRATSTIMFDNGNSLLVNGYFNMYK